MKFSENWLREWVNPDLSTEELGHQITMAGLEVDSIEAVAPEHSGVVVGQILSAEQHPDADKLQVCKVDVGNLSEAPLQIVCGAANARAGLRVACAMVKAKLPGGFKIKKSKLRGVESFGMLCSEKELGLAESSDGIMELSDQAPIGTTLVEYYQLNDNSIELGLTPNRSDCLSIEGVARDTAAITSTPMTVLDVADIEAQVDDELPIRLSAAAECPRYVGRIIKGINVNAETPLWMVEKLRRSGIRSISPTVDITNYVMLELGQPMHAFDLSTINGGINVRLADQGEKLELLDGQSINLNSDNLVIADHQKALALAGIMGGLGSSVTDKTTDILLESAFFSPQLIAGKARAHGLHTDSSHRFERGVSADLQIRAIQRATQLMLEIVGGTPAKVLEEVAQEYIPKQEAIEFKYTSIKKLLGVEVDKSAVQKMLEQLQMQVEATADGWNVTAPAFRFDIQIEADLIEEVARIYGYDNLPVSQPHAPVEMAPCPEALISEKSIRNTLVALDYQEVINYSFVDPKNQKLIDPDVDKLLLSNPISEDMSEMRTTMWPGLISSLVYNQNRQQSRIRLFEIGTRFVKTADDLNQQSMLAAIVSGSSYSEQWGQKSQAIDFFDLKSDLEAVLSLGGKLGCYRFVADKHPALHPGQTARVFKDDKAIGWIGTLHPSVAKQLQVKNQTILFEVELDEVLEASIPSFKVLSKFPAIRRDIAIIVDNQVPVEDIMTTIKQNAGQTLTDVLLFDQYTGAGIDVEKKSLAIGITLQEQSRTLTDQDVDIIISEILQALEQQHRARLRD